MREPQYRPRVGEFRIYCNVTGNQVDILGIVQKSETAAWLASKGAPNETSGTN